MLYRHTEPPGTIIGTHSWSGRPFGTMRIGAVPASTSSKQ